MQTIEKILSVENISKKYISETNTVVALKNVSFDLFAGEMLSVMGTSGSGKSTLLHVLGALDAPDGGVIRLKGVIQDNIFNEPAASVYRSNTVGFVFQNYNLLKDLTVEENIALPLILQGMEHSVRVKEMLETVGLMKWKKHRPIQLSGGQQQRVAIARALITTPPIVLADEPTGNLDYNTSIEILKFLTLAKDKMKQSIILVTHDPMVAAYADRVLFFHDGEIVDNYACSPFENNTNRIIDKFKSLLEKK
ncbi:ABC transporter ATP-binding protein [Cohnella endophytica]|uniref:ABC transporter ATP-binding protein n=1 Tax=Cohnella endophytica TaxID=2419778 RepID=A0A494XGJ4_9BACL|nr:ABC transporter ATP-binding protein [Cohnella endophytica]RKP48962.1 ABC transporter ATP-binding protein [Cohnella endophytica]